MGKTLQQGEELFASQSSNKRSRRAKEHDHNDKVAVRIGEASHPGPRSRKLRNLDQHVSVWTCNTQGPKQSWTLQQLLQTQEQAPQIVLLQECSFSQAEWTHFKKLVGLWGTEVFSRVRKAPSIDTTEELQSWLNLHYL